MMKLFGGIFIAIGLIVMALSGLCTGYFVITFLSASGSGFGGVGAILLPLVVGGIPFAFGFLAFFGGRKMIEAANEEERRR